MRSGFLAAAAICAGLYSSAQATIYLTAIDPATHTVGMAVISSGPVVTYNPRPMSGVKGVGFVGWSGNAANVSPATNKAVFEMMSRVESPEQIEAYVDQQIHNKYSRFMFVSAINGTFGHVFPPRGCAEPECDALIDPAKQFMIMGGGLQHNVVANAMTAYQSIQNTPNLAFECKLLLGLQAIIRVGGEIKEFNQAQIGVDHPNQSAQEIFSSTAGEAAIPADLQSKIARVGIQCPLARNVPNAEPKLKRSASSMDL